LIEDRLKLEELTFAPPLNMKDCTDPPPFAAFKVPVKVYEPAGSELTDRVQRLEFVLDCENELELNGHFPPLPAAQLAPIELTRDVSPGATTISKDSVEVEVIETVEAAFVHCEGPQ
jgi:hypothetical protein